MSSRVQLEPGQSQGKSSLKPRRGKALWLALTPGWDLGPGIYGCCVPERVSLAQWCFSPGDFFPVICTIFSPSGLGVLLSETQTGPTRGQISPQGTKAQTALQLPRVTSPTGTRQEQAGCTHLGTTRGWGATKRPVQATELRKQASRICLETASKLNRRATIERSAQSKPHPEISHPRWKRRMSTAAL